MAETGGYTPPEAKQPDAETLAVQQAERVSGQTLAEIAREVGLPPDGAAAVIGWMDQVMQDNPGLAAATGAVHEARTNDEYRLPNLSELMNGGGRYWRPLFSAERTGEISSEDDLQAMAERGLPHMLTDRESLSVLLEQLPQGEQTSYKALSARILEMRVKRSLIEHALTSDNSKLAEQLLAGMNMEDLLKQGEQLGLLKPARLGGKIASDADDIRSSAEGAHPARGITMALLTMESRLGNNLRQPHSRLHLQSCLCGSSLEFKTSPQLQVIADDLTSKLDAITGNKKRLFHIDKQANLTIRHFLSRYSKPRLWLLGGRRNVGFARGAAQQDRNDNGRQNNNFKRSHVTPIFLSCLKRVVLKQGR